ncbi:hypothetical protein EJB05_49273, partial [Eragrostis curvula]
RLPAKEICRFRAVCRHWHSLTTDPLFIDAHAARHPGPLIVASFKGDDDHVHLMDLSGHVVKRLPVPPWNACLSAHVMCSRLDLIVVANTEGRCSVINPATGAVSHLRKTLPDHSSSEEELALNEGAWRRYPDYHVFALGRVESTGEYKVLRIASEDCMWYDFDDTSCLECSVLSVNGGSCRIPWRSTGSPEYGTEIQKKIMNGYDIEPDFIAAFDLDTEEWTTIPGPRPEDDHGSSDDGEDMDYRDMCSGSTLAELSGYLVLLHERDYYSRLFDVWFLKDTENHVWEKEYSIWAPKSVFPARETVKPFLLLDDGRIAFFLHHKGVLLLYDPTTKVFSEVDTGRLRAIGLYTGNLLSLQNVA